MSDPRSQAVPHFLRTTIAAWLLFLAEPALAEPVATSSRARRALSVEQALAAAMAQSPTRSAAELTRDRAQQGVLAEEGRYPYVFAADAGYTQTRSARLGANDSVSGSTSRTFALGAALRRTFPSGASAELRLGGEVFDSDVPAAATFAGISGSGYGVNARASLTQPLLRGAGARVGELELRASRVDREAADRALRRIASATARDVLLRYWELWYAESALGIERAALELARQQEREAMAKVEQGALALADSFAFSTRVAELEEALVSAENACTQRALELSVAMGEAGPDATLLSAASELPEPGPLSTRAAVEQALASESIELAELEAQLKAAAVRAEAAGESARPRLDLEGYLESQGVGERISSAAERAAGAEYVTAHIGVVGELPLDRTRYNAERTSALLAVKIVEQNLRAARVRLAAEASAAHENEAASLRRLELARKTLAIAEKAHAAESGRFELGQSIPIQVRQAEDELRRARLRVTRARVDVIEEQVALAHLQGKLAQR